MGQHAASIVFEKKKLLLAISVYIPTNLPDSALPIMYKTVTKTGPEVIKLFSCSTQVSMKFFLLIYVKMPTIVGILTCMSGKNSILGLSKYKKAELLDIFILMSI